MQPNLAQTQGCGKRSHGPFDLCPSSDWTRASQKGLVDESNLDAFIITVQAFPSGEEPLAEEEGTCLHLPEVALDDEQARAGNG